MISAPRTACATAAASRTSPSRTSNRPPFFERFSPSKFSRLPLEKLSSTRTNASCSSKAPTMCDPMNPAPPVTRYRVTLPASATQHCTDRAQHNQDVHHQRAMLDVVEIVLQLDRRFCDIGEIGRAHV